MTPRRTKTPESERRLEAKKGPPIPPTDWPESLVSKNDDIFFSVTCGNSSLHWATHKGQEHSYSPSLFWRTPLINPNEMVGSPATLLSQHVPVSILKFLFGSEEAPPTKENALAHSLNRRVPTLTVYVVASSTEQAEYLSYLWSEIPCRLYMMQPDDFFTKLQGRYDGMGIDRLATLRGAAEQYSYPLVVIDGGTALTFTALDSRGQIMGGGIGAGLLTYLNSLGESAEALPFIDHNEIMEFLKQAEKSNQTLRIVRNTKHTRRAMMTHAVLSLAFTLQGILCDYAQEIQPKKDTEGKPVPLPVVICGGDAEILKKLLPPSNLVQTRHDLPELNVICIPKLLHYGIAEVLKDKMKETKEDPVWETDQQLVGQRVARRFNAFDENGENIYRGTVMAFAGPDDNGNLMYRILYDDNDKEDLNELELYEALVLYSERGERSVTGNLLVSNLDKPKVAGAKASALLLENTRDMVKDSLAKKKAGRFPPTQAPQEILQRPVTMVVTLPAAASEDVEPPVVKKPAVPPPAAAKPPKRTSTTPDKGPTKKKAKLFEKNGAELVDKRIAKMFYPFPGAEEMELFFGTITSYTAEEIKGVVENFWEIRYDDDDGEWLGEKDMEAAFRLYEKNRAKDPKPQ